MDWIQLLAAVAKTATDPLEHYSLLVGLVGGVLVAISLLWKGVPAVWKRLVVMRTKHREAITSAVVRALEPKFVEMRDHLDAHMKREEEELADRTAAMDDRDRALSRRIASMERGLSGIAGALDVDLRTFGGEDSDPEVTR